MHEFSSILKIALRLTAVLTSKQLGVRGLFRRIVQLHNLLLIARRIWVTMMCGKGSFMRWMAVRKSVRARGEGDARPVSAVVQWQNSEAWCSARAAAGDVKP